MMAYEYDDDVIIVDCGVMFPDAELLGVDIVIPDLSYVRENRERIRAILLTHGHEDHIGGLPYLLEEVDAPVYGSPFTLALAHSKLIEHDLAESADLREMQPRTPFQVGPFRIEFIHLTHSIIQSGALAITTPLGTVIHTGDFKLDPTPTDHQVSDLHTLADYGRQRRAGAVRRFHQRGTPRPDAFGKRRPPAPFAHHRRRQGAGAHFLLCHLHAPLADRHRPGA